MVVREILFQTERYGTVNGDDRGMQMGMDGGHVCRQSSDVVWLCTCCQALPYLFPLTHSLSLA